MIGFTFLIHLHFCRVDSKSNAIVSLANWNESACFVFGDLCWFWQSNCNLPLFVLLNMEMQLKAAHSRTSVQTDAIVALLLLHLCYCLCILYFWTTNWPRKYSQYDSFTPVHNETVCSKRVQVMRFYDMCVCVKERKRFRGIDLHFQGVKLEANFSRLFMSIYLPFDALFHTPQIATRCQYSLHAACEEEYLNMVCTYTQKKIVSLPYSFGSNEYREVQSIDVVSTSSAAQPPYSLDKFGTSDICIFSAHNK